MIVTRTNNNINVQNTLKGIKVAMRNSSVPKKKSKKISKYKEAKKTQISDIEILFIDNLTKYLAEINIVCDKPKSSLNRIKELCKNISLEDGNIEKNINEIKAIVYNMKNNSEIIEVKKDSDISIDAAIREINEKTRYCSCSYEEGEKVTKVIPTLEWIKNYWGFYLCNASDISVYEQHMDIEYKKGARIGEVKDLAMMLSEECDGKLNEINIIQNECKEGIVDLELIKSYVNEKKEEKKQRVS